MVEAHKKYSVKPIHGYIQTKHLAPIHCYAENLLMTSSSVLAGGEMCSQNKTVNAKSSEITTFHLQSRT